jgi:hypothetical protein
MNAQLKAEIKAGEEGYLEALTDAMNTYRELRNKCYDKNGREPAASQILDSFEELIKGATDVPKDTRIFCQG